MGIASMASRPCKPKFPKGPQGQNPVWESISLAHMLNQPWTQNYVSKSLSPK